MNLVEFLKDLSAQNVELWLDGDRLRYRGPKDALTPTLFNKIKQYKAEIIQLLREGISLLNLIPLPTVSKVCGFYINWHLKVQLTTLLLQYAFAPV